MRFTFSIAMLAMCLVALQCAATKDSEGNDGPSSPQQSNAGGHTGSGTVEVQQVSPDPPSPDHLAPGIAAPAAQAAAAGKGSKGGDGGESGEGREIAPPPVGAGDPNGSLPAGSSGSGAGAGGDAEKTVTITTTSTAANAALINPLPEANQPQQPQGPAQQGHGQGTENAHENSRAAQPKEPQIVTTTTTKPETQLEDKGSAKVNTDSGVEGEQTHQAGPPPNVSTTKAVAKQIISTPSRGTVEGKKQNDGRQPSTKPDAGKPVVKDPNTAPSRGEEVHAPELPLEPHTETGVSEDLTKTQPAQEQTPPLSVKPQTPPSTTTVKENITPLVPATSTTTGTSKDTPLNNNPQTTSTAGELKVSANKPAVKTPKAPTNGDKETIPSKKSITSTSEPLKVESTAHLTPLPKLSDALQSLENKDTSIDSSSLLALAALATLVVMAIAPIF